MVEDCNEAQALLGGYALEALDAAEREFVKQHLPQCEGCRALLREYDDVAEGLLNIHASSMPPARVRAQILAMISAAGGAKSWAFLPRRISLAQALVTVVVVLLLVINASLLSQVSRLRTQLVTLTLQQQANQTGLAIASYPNTQIAQITGDGIGGTFVYDPDIRIAVAYIWGLEQLPSDQTYQAWLISPNGDRTSGGVIRPEEDSNFTMMIVESSQPISDFVGFGMTIEPEGGSSGPTGVKVLGAEL